MDSFVHNALLVNFEFVLTMADEGMVKMFRTLDESKLRGFLGVSGLVYEKSVTQFLENSMFGNAEIITIVSGVKVVADMSEMFSMNGAPFKLLSKKKDMEVEYQLLKNIVAKSLTVKAGSFDAVTTKCFEIIRIRRAAQPTVREDVTNGSWGIYGSTSPECVEHQVRSHRNIEESSFHQTRGCDKAAWGEGSKTCRAKKKKALQGSKQNVEGISRQTAQMRSKASFESVEHPLETIFMTKPVKRAHSKRTKKLKPLRAILAGAAQVTIPVLE
ncbi:TMV resistance protein N-like [Dorcoceras hygrometricum]|uniref:TMV resistance protein N-like n=1 Tax=Dorcoceras hygrometricum TaxID=472368 RepID=A0A2Z7B6A4_9LAMI|nr:TMV resistance protein N-like [Dorcoceras hygrometricum]